MPSVALNELKKEKICSIKAAIAKARLTKPSLDYNLKKPLPNIKEVPPTQQRQIDCNLAPDETPLKPRDESTVEMARKVNEILQQRMFLPMISPIKELDEIFVIKPPKVKLHKERLIDNELKNFIDKFAKNIENLASGERGYKEINFPEVDRSECFAESHKTFQLKKTEVHPTSYN